MIFAAAGLPGVLAAAQGMQLQASICGPGGTDLPPGPGPAAESHNDHCKIFPCTGALSVGTPVNAITLFRPAVASSRLGVGDRGAAVTFRAELAPLNGRAPPPTS